MGGLFKAVSFRGNRLFCSGLCGVFALSIAVSSQFQTVSLRDEQDVGALRFTAIQPVALPQALPLDEGARNAGKISGAIEASLREAATAGTRAPARVPAPFPSLFGTHSISVANTAIMQRWRGILAEAADRNILLDCNAAADEFCGLPQVAAMRAEVARLRQAPRDLQVRAVNEFVNRNLRYASDLSVYGVPDHWASLREFLINGRGDCEDFAIAKLWMLSALGVPLDSIRLVVLRDQIARQDHAVLAVHHADGAWVLDNRSAVVRADAEIRHYRPYYSLSASGYSWVHSVPATAEGQLTTAKAQPFREAGLN